ncbi:unnamed protein product [Durusdinium trenchii]|uniref:Uncharacterized protein n=1 Tax=Durusdinium trenchii TaxID=1381693 RepID=A0ABP0QNR9_9DINO
MMNHVDDADIGTPETEGDWRSALNALTRRARSVLLPGDSESLTVPLALPGRTGSGRDPRTVHKRMPLGGDRRLLVSRTRVVKPTAVVGERIMI